ncbi:MAG: bacteriocin [Erysipelotrichaceae bacterium]
MNKDNIKKLSDEELKNVSGGEDVDIVFGTKDLTSSSTQNIQSYTEPNPILTITPFVENTQQTIQNYVEPSNDDADVTIKDPENIPVVPYLIKNS